MLDLKALHHRITDLSSNVDLASVGTPLGEIGSVADENMLKYPDKGGVQKCQKQPKTRPCPKNAKKRQKTSKIAPLEP